MFKNVGRKIKILAKIFFWIGIVCSVVMGVGIAFGFGGNLFMSLINSSAGTTIPQDLNFSGPVAIIAGAIVLIVGFLAAWLESLFVYGFGELIDNTSRIRRKLSSRSNDEYDA